MKSNIRKNLLLLCCSVITGATILAQSKQTPITQWEQQLRYQSQTNFQLPDGKIYTDKGNQIDCGDNINYLRMQHDESFLKRQAEVNELIYKYIIENQEEKRRVTAPCTSGPNSNVVTIPVVVHVMHLSGTPVGTSENISDAQIIAGIQHMNDAFRDINSYAPGPLYTNAGITDADIEIEFCLATRAPNGTASTGINRVATTYSNLFSDDIVSGSTTQDDALKALSYWNSTQYLNIWLVKEICSSSPSTGCGVAGYAYLAGAHGQAYDGVVNEAAYFGSSVNNSKVHIHEVGHYLNLSHTFNDPDGTSSLTSCDNTNCLTQGDYVCDTPPDAGTTAYNCSTSQTANTCSTDANDVSANNPFTSDVQDIYEDYMDYGYQSCQNTFTPGQKARMRAALFGIRASLLNSLGCTPVTVTEGNLSNVIYPGSGVTIACNPLVAIVTLTNNGTGTITSAEINYQLNGGAINTHTWTGSLAAGASTNISLPAVILSGASQNLYVTLGSLNGAGVDSYADNNEYCRTFNFASATAITNVAGCQQTQNMDASITENSWSVTNPDALRTWAIYNVADPSGCSHGQAAYMDFYNYSGSGQLDYLTSQVFDLTGVTNPYAYLQFDVAYAPYGSSNSDSLRVNGSSNCGVSWASIYYKGGLTLGTIGGYYSAAAWFPTTCAQWRRETVNISSYISSGSFQAQFVGINDFGNNLFIDNVCIVTSATPLAVDIVNFSGKLIKEKVQLDWQTASEQNADYFTVEKSLDGSRYEFLGKVKAAGNSSESNSYRLIDEYPTQGLNYYKLSQTDFDGESAYLDVVTVSYHKGVQVAIYPNPTQGNQQINLQIMAQKETDAIVEIFDLAGRLMLSRDVLIAQNENNIPLDILTLPIGTYAMRVKMGESVQVFRFIKS